MLQLKQRANNLNDRQYTKKGAIYYHMGWLHWIGPIKQLDGQKYR